MRDDLYDRMDIKGVCDGYPDSTTRDPHTHRVNAGDLLRLKERGPGSVDCGESPAGTGPTAHIVASPSHDGEHARDDRQPDHDRNARTHRRLDASLSVSNPGIVSGDAAARTV